MKVHHVGILVKNIEKSINIYEKLGYIRATDIVIDRIQINRIVFIESLDMTQWIELIEPIDTESSVYNFKKGYHHICYDVSDMPDFFSYFKSLQIGKLFTKLIQAPAIDNRCVVFGCLNNGMFVEFLL